MAGVLCGNCGADVAETGNEPVAKRRPCSHCGSISRQVFAAVSERLSLKDAFSATITTNIHTISNTADVLLQTVIIANQKTSEGRLVEAVASPWFDIIELLKQDPNIAFQMSSDKWEEIVAGGYQKAGFDEVIITPRSGDFGRDVIAIKKGIGTIRVIAQVKAYKPGLLVTAEHVRALYGVLVADGAAKGVLATTSKFAPLLLKDPLMGQLIGSRLELIDGQQLITQLVDLAKKGYS